MNGEQMLKSGFLASVLDCVRRTPERRLPADAAHPDGLQATRSSHDERRTLNEKALRDHLPDLTIVDVDADHFGILKGGLAVI